MLLRIAAAPPVKAATNWVASSLYAPFKWGYDAILGTHKRKAPTGVQRSEDAEATPAQRAKLLSGSRDLARNFTLVGWAVRKHLDYVSTFTFQPKGKNPEANAKIEKFMKWWERKENFDIAARHGLSRFIRLGEAARVVDGDVAFAKLTTGHVQAIESDRIRNQMTKDFSLAEGAKLIQGIIVNEYGRALQYAVSKRGAAGAYSSGAGNFEFERFIDAADVVFHAYYTRFDQVRGISPLAPAINTARDLYEGFDYALAKLKIAQLLGLIIFSDAAEPTGETEDTEEAVDADGNPTERYQVKFGNAPFKLELDAQDRAEFLEPKTPSTEFQAFTQTMIALVLKAFDIPYSFYSENFSNYSGSRQALLQYEQSAEQRRGENRDVLNQLTEWRLKKAIDEGDPMLEGVTYDDLVWEWVAASLPWIDPLKETTANAAGVDRGFTNVPDVCKTQGRDAIDIATRQADYEAAVIKIRTDRGLPAIPTAQPINYTEVSNGESSDATAA